MEIIASTKDGVLIQATSKEVSEIIGSVNGEYPKELKIGQKIPAIDYASTIKKIKNLKDSYTFTSLLERCSAFKKETDSLSNAVEQAANLSID